MPTVVLPAERAYAEGKEIYFIHTEASEAGIAQKLTGMMNSPVFYVPALAKIETNANVYAFDNGAEGLGLLGFQPEVCDNPPGGAGYSPLRNLNVVSWVDPAKARELKAVAEILEAEKAGEVTIKQPGVIINMPFVVWDGGKR
jgi:hypothetical protein